MAQIYLLAVVLTWIGGVALSADYLVGKKESLAPLLDFLRQKKVTGNERK